MQEITKKLILKTVASSTALAIGLYIIAETIIIPCVNVIYYYLFR